MQLVFLSNLQHNYSTLPLYKKTVGYYFYKVRYVELLWVIYRSKIVQIHLKMLHLLLCF